MEGPKTMFLTEMTIVVYISGGWQAPRGEKKEARDAPFRLLTFLLKPLKNLKLPKKISKNFKKNLPDYKIYKCGNLAKITIFGYLENHVAGGLE